MIRNVLALLVVLSSCATLRAEKAASRWREDFAQIGRHTLISSLYCLSEELQGPQYPKMAGWFPIDIYGSAGDVERVRFFSQLSADFPNYVDFQSRGTTHYDRPVERWFADQETKQADQTNPAAALLAKTHRQVELLNPPTGLAWAPQDGFWEPGLLDGAQVETENCGDWITTSPPVDVEPFHRRCYLPQGGEECASPPRHEPIVAGERSQLRHFLTDRLAASVSLPQPDAIAPRADRWVCPVTIPAAGSRQWVTTQFGSGNR